MKKLLLLSFIFFLSCTPGGIRGEYSGNKIKTGTGNLHSLYVNLDMGSLAQMAEIAIRFEKIIISGKNVYYMHSYIYSGDIYFIKEVRIILDSKTFTFESKGGSRSDLNGGYTQEFNFYDIDRDFIKKITEAEKVEIQLRGSRKYLIAKYTEKHNKFVKEFLKKTE
jgi:hypothetical protein